MKRLFALPAVLMLLFGLGACNGTALQSGPGQPQAVLEGTPSPGGSFGPGQSTPAPSPAPEASGAEGEAAEGGVLVAYFSATGNTEAIALHLQRILDADLYAIVPQIPYTDEDLHYNDENCRANQEQNDPAARPAIAGVLENPASYRVMFLGYPIWWGQAPRIISTFLEGYDFGGITIVPFCTSGSSGIGSSADSLKALAANAQWLPGQRFSGNATQDDVAAWVAGLELPGLAEGLESSGTQLRLAFAGGEAVVTLEDNATARDFLTMLPATLTFSDYAATEKISYLTRALSTAGAPERFDPQAGDVALYAPWGNLAIFYGDAGSAAGLIPMGRVTDGLERLSAMEGDFEAAVSILE